MTGLFHDRNKFLQMRQDNYFIFLYMVLGQAKQSNGVKKINLECFNFFFFSFDYVSRHAINISGVLVTVQASMKVAFETLSFVAGFV